MGSAFESLLFWLVDALAWVGLGALVLLPLLLLRRLRGGGRRWVWVLPALAAVAFVAWGAMSYRGFEQDCATTARVETSMPAGVRAVGIAIDAPPGEWWHEFHWDAVIESGGASFVDVDGTRWCAGPPVAPGVSQFPRQRDCAAYSGRTPEFIVHVRAPERIAGRWHAPEYRLVLEVEERATGTIRARATDRVYGGGVVGFVQRAIRGGDQDYARLGCGYAADGIGPWRPTLSSRPEFAAYRRADRALVAAAVIASEQAAAASTSVVP